MKRRCFLALIACISLLFVSRGGEIDNEMVFPGSIKPLVSHGDPLIFWNVPTSWWHIPRDYVAVEEGIIRIFTTPKRERVVFNYREMPRGPESRYRLIAEVDWNGKGEASAHVNALEKRNLFLRSAPRERLKEVGNQKVELLLELPHEINGVRPEWVSFGFNVSGDGAELTIRSVSFKPVPDPTKSGLGRVVVDGKVCDSIVVSLDGSDKGFFDKRAARVLRQYIYRMCGELLPIYSYEAGKKTTRGKILVGRAASKSGVIEEPEFNALKAGGYILSVENGSALIAGKDGTGTISAVWDLLKRVGVNYYSSTDIEIPTFEKINIKPIKTNRSPFFHYRVMDCPWWFYEDYTPFGFTDANILGEASLVTLGAKGSHTSNALVDYRIYGEKHPEYYALGEDGKRLHIKPDHWRFDVHLCLSNSEVQRIATENVMKWMALQPHAEYFWVTPGDGTAGFCQCANCLALDLTPGDYSERQYYFNQIISNKIKKLFPDNKILSLAYTQRFESPPTNYCLAENMLSVYCFYPRNWDCQSHAFCSHNSEGVKTLSKWTDAYPEKLIYYLYPRAREQFSLYAVFYAHVELIRHAASHNAAGISFNWTPLSFAPLYLTVISELCWNPDIDVEKSIDRFMAEYFGSAAPGMRRFFNLLYDEIKSRPFHQNIEDLNPGLATAGFAKKSYECFADSERAVAEQPKYLARVLREKMFLLWNDLNDRNIGNGQVDSAEFYPKLAEFVELARRDKWSSGFVRHQTPEQWFWSVGQIEVKTRPWYQDKDIESLLANPVEFAESRRVIIQEDIPGGWRLPLRGFAGGTPVKPYSYLCEPRQETSGIRRPAVGRDSRMWCVFKIAKAPKGEYVIVIEGQDDEKEGRALFSIVINGTTVFSGENAFAERGWSRVAYRIPEGVLKKGENRLDFINITPEKDAHLQKTDVDETIGRRVDPFWGWILFSEVKIHEK